MKKRSLFLSGLLATSLLVGGVLVGCGTTDAGEILLTLQILLILPTPPRLITSF